jgi:hypothetical protein
LTIDRRHLPVENEHKGGKGFNPTCTNLTSGPKIEEQTTTLLRTGLQEKRNKKNKIVF